jgi:hypothetical protein
LLIAALTVTSCASLGAKKPSTEVMVIGAVHSAHNGHPTYSYEHLFATVRQFDPDVVAVEIRQEDLKRDANYLARNYPYEMRALAQEYGAKAVGFDWLGAELEGRAVPENWWKEQSWLKRLEREKGADRTYRAPEVDALRQRQLELIRSATAATLNDGRYDDVTRAYYEAFAKSVAGSRYDRLAIFYRERDRRIAENLRRIITEHAGKRVAVIMGADHRAHSIAALRHLFGPKITLVTVP